MVFAYSLETRLKKGRHNASTFLRCHVRVITRQFQFLFYFRLVNISKGKRLLVHFLPSSSHSARAEQRASKEKNFRAYSNEQKKKERETETGIKKKFFRVFCKTSSRILSSARSEISIITEVSFRVRHFVNQKPQLKRDESFQFRIESLIDVTRTKTRERKKEKLVNQFHSTN